MFGILHIDNATFYKSVFRKIAIQEDYTYYHASTCADAIAILKTQQVDLVITGTYVENQPLLSVIDQLTVFFRTSVPIIVFSSNHDAETRKRLYEKGIVGFYEKNASLEKLMHAIDRVKEQKLLMKQAREMNVCILFNDLANANRLLSQYTARGYQQVAIKQVESLSDLGNDYSAYIIDLEGDYHFVSDVVYTLRNQNPSAIIFCTLEYANYDLIHNILLSGADDYIIKPFHEKLFFAEFLSNVRNHWLMAKVQKQNDELRNIAVHDGLTELYNHTFMIQKLEELKALEFMYAIAMLDLDYFKQVNDTYGHQVGDTVLKKVAQLITDTIDGNSFAGRYGGEEFMIIGVHKNADELYAVAEEIRLKVQQLGFDEKDLKLTISGGISEANHVRPVKTIIEIADQKLYLAKSKGRNRIEHRADSATSKLHLV